MIFKSYPIQKPHYGGPCWLCRRRDGGMGFTEGNKWTPRVVWTCARHGKDLYEMAKTISLPEFDRIEQVALKSAGELAGDYLDSIGKTDLAALDDTQWITFLKTVVQGFGNSIEKHLEEVPF